MEAVQTMEMLQKQEQIQKKRGISGSTLKIIAVVTMLIDHIGGVILCRYIMASGYMEVAASGDMNVINAWLAENGTLFTWYTVTRYIGRVAFPIFCFLLVEGFLRTGNVKKYAMRLGAFALISEVPFDLALKAKPLDFTYQNVFFTLFIGLLTMVAFDRIGKLFQNKIGKLLLSCVALIAGAGLAELMSTDYGAIGVVSIILLYVLRNHKVWQIVGGCVAFLWELTAPLAFIPIGFYNGKRGLQLKYFFYAFYPLHLLILYLICVALGVGGIAAC